MSINGRISIDAIFHDTDGTASINVLSLNESEEYSTGVVAVITGTANGVQQGLNVQPTNYRNAAGNLVLFESISHVIIRSNSGTVVYGDIVNSVAVPPGKTASLATTPEYDLGVLTIYATGGTASYTIIMIGS